MLARKLSGTPVREISWVAAMMLVALEVQVDDWPWP